MPIVSILCAWNKLFAFITLSYILLAAAFFYKRWQLGTVIVAFSRSKIMEMNDLVLKSNLYCYCSSITVCYNIIVGSPLKH